MVRFLRLPEVIKQIGLSRSTIYAYIAEGQFPKPILLGPRAVAWNSEDIEDWMEAKIKEAQK